MGQNRWGGMIPIQYDNSTVVYCTVQYTNCCLFAHHGDTVLYCAYDTCMNFGPMLGLAFSLRTNLRRDMAHVTCYSQRICLATVFEFQQPSPPFHKKDALDIYLWYIWYSVEYWTVWYWYQATVGVVQQFWVHVCTVQYLTITIPSIILKMSYYHNSSYYG